MSKKKRHPKVAASAAPLPVLHGHAFVAMLDEARGICNELTARREWCGDAIEYLKQRGLLDEWSQWYEAKRAPKQG